MTENLKQIKDYRKGTFLSLLMMIVMLWPVPIIAQGRSLPPIIRDTEIEETFKEWSEPILDAARVDPGSVNIILVQSPQINAFVAGGANIFFYTGLLQKTDGPGEILGVFAHELGHITGSHLIAGREAMKRASYESILGVVLGIGAAILSGDSGAAAAGVSGGSTIAGRRFLAHTRINESSADQAALSFFETAKFNPEGLGTFLEKLQGEELLPSSRQSEYVRTHPLTRDRINAVEARADKSLYQDAAFPAHWYEQHARMKAKLIGFISPGQVAWTYDDRDMSIAAQYARAIAAYRENRTDEAVSRIDALIAEEPDNPYFYELKGQMLVDFSRIEDAIPAYRRSIEIKPDAALLRVALAHALIESGNDQARLKEATENLERALSDEGRSARIRRLLATAYGRMGQEDLAKVNLAEEAVLQRRYGYAKQQAASVLTNAPKDSRAWLKAKDVLEHLKTVKARG